MSKGSLFIVTMCGSILFASTALGQSSGRGGGRHGGGGQGRDAGPSDPTRNMKPPAPQIVLTPHGDEYLQTEAVQYEIVYMPLQTRIYLFDKKMKPLSARDTHVQMLLTLPSESNPRRIPFQYVAVPAVAGEQDYVVAVFDMRQLRDRETPITFEFSGLPDRRHPTASFTPVFSLAKHSPLRRKSPSYPGRSRRGHAAESLSGVGAGAWDEGADHQALPRRLSLVFVRGGLHSGNPAIAGKILAASNCNAAWPVSPKSQSIQLENAGLERIEWTTVSRPRAAE